MGHALTLESTTGFEIWPGLIGIKSKEFLGEEILRGESEHGFA